jgi:tetratricopeptide (TPR) repeat protein
MDHAPRPTRATRGKTRRLHVAAPWLRLACALSMAATGCQSPSPRKATNEEGSKLKGSTVGEKTEFQGEVGASQEVNVHLDLARALESQGNFESAVAECQKAIDASEGPSAHRGGPKVTAHQKALAHRRMAGALDRLGRFAQAETHYRQAMKLKPNDVNIWNDVGYSYYLQSR